MSNLYLYPAIFEPNEHNGFTITFPDLPGCITEGNDLAEGISMAQEALALHLYGMERDGDPIPEASSPYSKLIPNEAAKGSFINVIAARTAPIRDEMQNRAVKKTLTIPQWLNDEAEAAGLNFSQTLQFALKEKLGIIEKRP